MSTQPDQANNPKVMVERREHPRFEPPLDAHVDVELPCGSKVRARIQDISMLGGACLVFDDDPRLEVGNTVSVSYRVLRNEGEVRHVGEAYGKHLVGVRWSTNATMLAVACDPT